MRAMTIAAIGMTLCAAASRAAETRVQVRDAQTGAPVDATLALSAADHAPQSLLAMDGLAILNLGAGGWRIGASAPAHRSMQTTLNAGESSLPLTLLLDPSEMPKASRDAERLAATLPDATVLHGWVRDGRDAHAIADARIAVASFGATARSDAEGHFRIVLPAAAEVDGGRPPTIALRISTPGHASLERILVQARGAHRLILLLDTPAASDHALLDPDLSQREQGNDLDPALLADLHARAQITAMPPASALRVGFGDAGCSVPCCVGACTNTCAISLETYVARGLNDEWIASWGQHSLRAGSIAYRSYGAWHVLHPRNAAYDICSSACCQVNDADTSANTDAAVARTPGIMLTRDDLEPFRAEYSAENNAWDDPADGLDCSNADLSCGNGSVGSPATNWPCMADSVASGHGCFGHGRGMSQWGTQRWSQQSKLWRWIADHYFNDNNNVSGAGGGLRTALLTSPLSIASASAAPSSAAPGSLLTVSLSAANSAGAAHTHLLIGASLYRGDIGYLSDPINDAAATLAANIAAAPLQRSFRVPASAPGGTYALDVALYTDVDENGIITSDDLRLAYLRTNATVALGDVLFADSFE